MLNNFKPFPIWIIWQLHPTPRKDRQPPARSALLPAASHDEQPASPLLRLPLLRPRDLILGGILPLQRQLHSPACQQEDGEPQDGLSCQNQVMGLCSVMVPVGSILGGGVLILLKSFVNRVGRGPVVCTGLNFATSSSSLYASQDFCCTLSPSLPAFCSSHINLLLETLTKKLSWNPGQSQPWCKSS